MQLWILPLFLGFGLNAFSQLFSLNDTTFELGAIYRPAVNIIYEIDLGEIRAESFPQLDSIAAFLLKNRSICIEVGVHVDTRASDSYSVRVDLLRARNVASYLEEKGVEADRLSAKGYYKDQPLVPDSVIAGLPTAEEQEAAHYMNRRTEFKIVEMRSGR